jgi:hypothetical protein
LPATAAAPNPYLLFARSMAAARAATSVHVAESDTSSRSPTGFDLRLVTGTGGAGTLIDGANRFDIIQVRRFLYFRAGANFWLAHTSRAAAKRFANHWVRTPVANKDFAWMTELTDIRKLLSGLASSSGSLKLGQTKTIRGTPAVGLLDGGGGTIWVAASGTPFPLLLTAPDLSLSFDSWDTPIRLTAPRAFFTVG